MLVGNAVLGLLPLAIGVAEGLGATDTITWGGDNSRSGYQTNHNMDPAIVGSSQFIQLFQTTLPGNYLGSAEQIFSQPLVYTPLNSTTQFVYWATTQNNVYKMDAATGEILLSRNLHIPFQQADLDGCTDIDPYIGVTGTGVIDPDTDTLYLAAKTYEDQDITTPQGKPAGRYYIHAIDANDLSERPNFPINFEGLVPRNSPTRNFNGGIQLQRPGLLQSGQFIYAGFGSHCVQYNFTGWLIGLDKTSGELVENWATEGEGVPNSTPGGSIWQSGGAIASDDSGSMFFATGNGYASQLADIPVNGHNPPTAIEEAACHLTINDDGSTTLIDFFMPWNKQELDGDDKDLGVTPLELLPSEFSCGTYTRMGCVTDKFGMTYFLDMDNLGGYRNGADGYDDVIASYQQVSAVYAGAGVYPVQTGSGYIYINVVGYPTYVFEFSCENDIPAFTEIAQSKESSAGIRGVSHGTVTSLDGQEGTGIFWVSDLQDPGVRIYDAVPENGELQLINSFSAPGVTKFTRPVFGDGRLYLGTTNGLVYGFGAPTTAPMNCSTVGDFGTVDLGASSSPVTVTCTAVIGVTVNTIELNSTVFNITGVPTLPLTLAVGGSLSFQSYFSPSTVGSDSADVEISTTNSEAGYSILTALTLDATGESSAPLLQLTPLNLTYGILTTGEFVGGVNESFILTNLGNTGLDVTEYQVSATGTNGTFVSGTSVGLFTFLSLPSQIPSNSQDSAIVNFAASQNGSFEAYLRVISDGGTQNLLVSAHSGGPPVTLIEFETPDGSGWVEFVPGQNFTFGNVTENTTKNLNFRITNNSPPGSNALTLTVSKPPFGQVGSLIETTNDVDLGEGSSIAAGQSQNASMYCSVPKAQWDTDSYEAYATWTINTDDDNFGKKDIGFVCNAVSEQAPPLDSNGQAIYRYLGCFKDNNPDRQLSTQLYSNPNNTNEMCIAQCAAGGYTFCGTEYQVECWAGPSIPIQEVDEDDCNYSCGGDVNQVCGGSGVGADDGGAFISLFANSQVSNGTGNTGPPQGPVVNPGIDGYVSLGCWAEPADARALQNQFSTTPETVDSCLDYCAGMYVYAGLEYGGQCWCDNVLNPGAAQVNISDCSMTCNDNSTEYCGGPVRLNLYKANSTAVLTSTTAASSVPSSTPTNGPSVNPGIDGYSFIGCYKEPTNSRALEYQFATTPETVDSCLSYCADTYIYAGLEYGGECWCDNVLSDQATLTDVSACSMTCNDNSTEYCGGPVLLNLYEMGSSSTSLPTSATDISTPATAQSATGGLPSTASSMAQSPTTSVASTLSQPQSPVPNVAFTTASLTSGANTLSSNTPAGTTGITSSPKTSSTKTVTVVSTTTTTKQLTESTNTTGNHLVDAPAALTTPSSSSTTGSMTSTGNSISTASATKGYYHVGCFADNNGSPVLPLLFANDSVTPQLCIEYANSIYDHSPTPTARLPFLYLEGHNSCHGGKLLDFATAVTSLVGSRACSDVCSESITTISSYGETDVVTRTANCGGVKQFDLYALTSSAALPTDLGPVVTGTPT